MKLLRAFSVLTALVFGCCCRMFWSIQAAQAHPQTSVEICLEPSPSGRSRQGVVMDAFLCARQSGTDLVFTDGYEDCLLRLDQTEDAAAMKQALSFLESRLHSPAARAEAGVDGRVRFDDLSEGLYFFKVSGPAGYDLVENILLLLPAQGKDGLSDTIRVEAKILPLPDLVILKTDPQGTVIRRPFSFTSFADPKLEHPLEEKSADPAFGQIIFCPKLNQKFYLQESRAPQGYRKSLRIMEVFLAPDGSLYLDGRKQTSSGGKVVIEYVNEPLNSSGSLNGSSTDQPFEPARPAALKAVTSAFSHQNFWLAAGAASLAAGMFAAFRLLGRLKK